MFCFDDYSYAAPCAKAMMVNDITTFLFHIAQCITFGQKYIVTAKLIAKALLNSFYPRLGFKVIKDFAKSLHFDERPASDLITSLEIQSIAEKNIGLQ